MKFKNHIFLSLTIVFACLSIALSGCSKDDDMTIPPQVPFFMHNAGQGSFRAEGTNPTFKIPVGLTAASNTETRVEVTVSSPTGAQQGTQYSLNKTTLVFPAGVVTDTIEVTGISAAYLAGRKDTLVFSFANGKEGSSQLRSNYKLVVSGPCFEGDVDLASFVGTWTTNEDFGGSEWGPYQTTVTAVEQLSPTTGTISIRNLYDSGWNPVTFMLDWTDPNNRTVTLSRQTGIGDAGSLGYDGDDVQVRAFAGEVGTFSACNKTITLKMQLGITGLGFFGDLYTVELSR